MGAAGHKLRQEMQRRVRRRRAREAPPGFYTRAGLRAKVGLSEPQLRSLLSIGVIVAEEKNSAGYTLYSEQSVRVLMARKAEGMLFKTTTKVDTTEYPATIPSAPTPTPKPVNTKPIKTSLPPRVEYSAEDGVRVFELLALSRPVMDIILETKIHPLTVKQIQHDYDEFVGSVTITKSIMDEINKLTKLPGSFPLRTGSDLAETLILCTEDRTCSECTRNHCASLCAPCVRRLYDRELAARHMAQQQQAQQAQAVEEAAAPVMKVKATGTGR